MAIDDSRPYGGYIDYMIVRVFEICAQEEQKVVAMTLEVEYKDLGVSANDRFFQGNVGKTEALQAAERTRSAA